MRYDWVFIGAGNMAGSIVSGMIDGGSDASGIAVFDTSSEARTRFAERFACTAVSDLQDALPAQGVVIAVKPDIVERVCRDLAATGQPLALVVSVAAGVRAAAMQAWLPEGTAVVRCMPNTPALLGVGASGLFANDACSQEQMSRAQDMLAAVGRVFTVSDESQLDAVTALSGSGPAYFFYLIEHMAAIGAQLGLPADVARELAIETGFGAASMARQGEDLPGDLRRKVTSKGGTTAAAIKVFDNENLPALIEHAMQAAFDRAEALGREFS